MKTIIYFGISILAILVVASYISSWVNHDENKRKECWKESAYPVGVNIKNSESPELYQQQQRTDYMMCIHQAGLAN